MDVIPDAPADRRTTATVSYPTLGGPVPRDDWYLLWGPLGMYALAATVIVVVLWKRLLTERKAADDARADERKEMRTLMEAHADKLEELGREHAGQFQATAEKLHILVGSLRDALDATSKRVIR